MSTFLSNLTLLSQLDPLVPTNDEANSKWPSVDRQTRDFLKTFLGKIHSDDGSLAAGSVGVGALNGKVVDGATNIIDASVVTANLADGSVTTAKLAGSVISAFTPPEPPAVTTEKITDLAVTTAKLADRSVTEIKIALGAVTGLVDPISGVATGNIATNTIDPKCIQQLTSSDTNPMLPVCAGNKSAVLPIGGDITAAVVGGVLELTLASGAGGVSTYARFERTNPAVTGAYASGLTSILEVVLQNWSLDTSYISVLGSKIEYVGNQRFKFTEAGYYSIRAKCPAYLTAGQRVVLRSYTSPTDLSLNPVIFYGPAGYDGYGDLSVILKVTAANEEYYFCHQYVYDPLGSTPLFGNVAAMTNGTYGTIEITKL